MVRANGETDCSTSSFVLSTFASPNKTVLVLSCWTTARSSASSCTVHTTPHNIQYYQYVVTSMYGVLIGLVCIDSRVT